jgi:hypothetical protein
MQLIGLSITSTTQVLGCRNNIRDNNAIHMQCFWVKLMEVIQNKTPSIDFESDPRARDE